MLAELAVQSATIVQWPHRANAVTMYHAETCQKSFHAAAVATAA